MLRRVHAVVPSCKHQICLIPDGSADASSPHELGFRCWFIQADDCQRNSRFSIFSAEVTGDPTRHRPNQTIANWVGVRSHNCQEPAQRVFLGEIPLLGKKCG